MRALIHRFDQPMKMIPFLRLTVTLNAGIQDLRTKTIVADELFYPRVRDRSRTTSYSKTTRDQLQGNPESTPALSRRPHNNEYLTH